MTDFTETALAAEGKYMDKIEILARVCFQRL